MASYIPLAEAMTAAGHACTLYHPPHIRLSEQERQGFGQVQTQAIAAGDVRDLTDVDVFFCSEAAGSTVPQGVVSVAIFHSLPDRYLLKTFYAQWLRNRPAIMESFDYVVAAVVQESSQWTVESYADVVRGAGAAADRGQAFGVIPGGYPKIEYLDRQFADRPPADTVIYCPTISGNAESHVVSHGAAILRTLHGAFDGDRIVFRPYPTDDKDMIAAVLAEVADLDRIVLDRSVTGMDEQRRARLAVTDKSSAAITFALCAERPAIFADMAQGLEPGFQSVILGYQANGMEGLVAAIADATSRQDWPAAIRQARIDHMYRPFDPCAYLAENLPLIADRGTRDDWLSIPRL